MDNENKVSITFLDGPLIGLTTWINPLSDRFLWYDEDDLGEYWAHVYVPVDDSENVWRHFKKKHAPKMELTSDELYEILD